MKQYFVIAVGIAILYFFLSNHIIFDQDPDDWFDIDIHLLKKSSLNLHYTFYSITSKKPKTIMRIDILRDDGIGELLVDIGMLTETERYRLEQKYGNE